MSKLFLPLASLALVWVATFATSDAHATALAASPRTGAAIGSASAGEQVALKCAHRRVCRPGEGCAWRKVCKRW